MLVYFYNFTWKEIRDTKTAVLCFLHTPCVFRDNALRFSKPYVLNATDFIIITPSLVVFSRYCLFVQLSWPNADRFMIIFHMYPWTHAIRFSYVMLCRIFVSIHNKCTIIYDRFNQIWCEQGFFQTTQLKLKTNAWWKYKYFSTDIVTPQIICKYAWGFLVRVNLFLKEKL